MVDQLSAFAGEVTRVAREVGTEGKLGVEAEVEGVSGVWRDLTENVNTMATTSPPGAQHRRGDDRGRERRPLEEGHRRRQGRDPRAEVDDQHDGRPALAFAAEVTRVAQEVGTEGKLGGQAEVEGVSGTWQDLTENVNQLADNLTDQVRNIAEVTTAVAKGDLSRRSPSTPRARSSSSSTRSTRWSTSSRSFADEVTRVAREVGTEGKLGGQAAGEGRLRHLARPDRQRQLHGRPPDRAGAQHRHRHDRGRERRPLQEDHRRRQGRGLRAQGHDQHDGRPARARSPPR